MSDVYDFLVCACVCHYQPVVHVVACCSRCPHCQKRIAMGFMGLHLEHCAKGKAPADTSQHPSQGGE